MQILDFNLLKYACKQNLDFFPAQFPEYLMISTQKTHCSTVADHHVWNGNCYEL